MEPQNNENQPKVHNIEQSIDLGGEPMQVPKSTGYEPGMYVKRSDVFGGPQMSANVMSTKKFMAEIDLMTMFTNTKKMSRQQDIALIVNVYVVIVV